MKFRTEIDIAPLGVKIGYGNRILALGSCFAEHIARRLAEARFRIVTNPTGILFNPLSIAAALRSYADETPVQHSELDFDGELWFHYGFHGSLSAASPDEALAAMNAARKARRRSPAPCRPGIADPGHGMGLRTQRAGGSQLPPATRDRIRTAQAGRRGDHRGIFSPGSQGRSQGKRSSSRSAPYDTSATDWRATP